LFFLGVAMEYFFDRLGDEIQANATTVSSVHTSSVAALVGGGFVVTWISNFGVAGDSDLGIRAQVFDALGNKVGSEFLVNTVTEGPQVHVSAAPLENGGFVITWRSGVSPSPDINAQLYDAEGSRVGSEFLVNATTTDVQQLPSVAGLVGGGFVIAWQDWSSAFDANGTGIVAQRYDSDGNAAGSAFLVNSTTAGDQTTPQVIARADGGFAITWLTPNNSPHNQIGLQLFDATGAKVGGEIVVAESVDSLGAPDVAELDSGFVVTWLDMPAHGQEIYIMAQRLNSNGVKIGSALVLGTLPDEGPYGPVLVAALSGGSFMVAWNKTDFNGGRDVRALVVDGEGQVGPQFTINYDIAGSQDLKALDVLDSGHVVAVWAEGAGSSTGIAVQILSQSDSPPGNHIVGTYGPDTLVGEGGDDMIEGSFDNDTLDGGLGNDAMNGGPGNDIYFLNSLGDQITEGSDAGYDTVFTSVSFTLGANVERVVAYDPASTSALNFTGNALANEISANAGANVIDGGAGADFMSGQGGNDVYFVDNAGDYVLETAGNGFDTVFATVSYTLTPEVERVFAYDPSSTAALNFTGNALNNELGGTAGANILDGGAGADLMVGGDGNDIYFVDNVGDVVSDSPTGGYDTVFASISFVLETRIERVVALDPNSTAALSFTGNAVANEITGNAGSNLINGGGGADILFGGAGGDAFVFTSALGGDNIAALPDFAVGSDRLYLDDAVFTALTPGALAAGP
jgi:serralysin